MRIFLLTLGFMTQIPVRRKLEYREGDLEKGLVYFPLIGLLLGSISCGVYLLLIKVLPEAIGIIGAMLAYLCLTGAFHLDGLCDTADGIYSSRTREKMLEIMKDSRLGTNGAIALALDLGIKFMGLYYLDYRWIAILLMPVAGKMIQGILGYQAVYPRKEGLGLYVGSVSLVHTIICYVTGAVFILCGYGIRGIMMCVMLLITAVLFRNYITKKLGGITGDVMGAGSEICEMVFLLTLLIIDGGLI